MCFLLPLRHALVPCFVLGTVFLSGSPAAHAQSSPSPASGWNSPEALELLRAAQRHRSVQHEDAELRNYQAEGRGYIYFLLDVAAAGRQELVRTDQVALEIYWAAPDHTKQRIIGLRERKDLPVTGLHYYLDRMTVVQDNYRDGIVIADGDNVNDVPHPAGSGAEKIYEYRLTDSLSLRLPGLDDPIRVYELRVRPRDPRQPAAIGSIFVDSATGALVRMDLTFTSAAYVDRRLDYINVSLENGLWHGRYWLPHEQRLEIRREIPELDFPVGTVIRTRMRVSGYRFNEPIEPWILGGPPVSMAPRAQRDAFPFEQDIHAELELEGIGPPTRDLAELRREGRELVRRHALSGLPRVRLGLRSASDLLRYNRAEGTALGLGAALRPWAGLSARLYGGWAFGPDHPLGRIDLATHRPLEMSGSAYANVPREVGGRVAVSGLLNTMGGLVAGEDYTDPFYASGVTLGARTNPGSPWTAQASLTAERHEIAHRTVDDALFGGGRRFRPVRPIDEGILLGGELRFARTPAAGSEREWDAELRLDGGTLGATDDRFTYLRGSLRAGTAWTWSPHDARVELGAEAGAAAGTLPRQALFLLGGRGTLPGYGFRAFSGDRYVLSRVAVSADLARPWIRGRAFAAAGASTVGEPGAYALERWGASTSGGVRASVGAGMGVFYDLLRVDLARGLGRDPRWELIIEANPRFWGIL